MVIDDNIMNIGGRKVELDIPPIIKDDRVFLPLRTLCEDVLNKKVMIPVQKYIIKAMVQYSPTFILILQHLYFR
jgi:hypothetical protein